MDRRVSTDFSDAVQRELAFLVDERGFRLIEVSDQIVRFASPEVVVTASYYPSEAQVDVTVTKSTSSTAMRS
jgi:hypothetical protein